MNGTREVLTVWERVFRNWKYALLLFVVGILFYLLNGLIVNIQNIKSAYGVLGFFGSARFLFFSSLRFIENVTTVSAIGILLLSIFVGALISLLVYRYNEVDRIDKKKVGTLGSLGILFGVAAPGCVACGVGLLSILGLTSALAVLPFQGQEIIVLAVGLVGYSVVNISRKLYNPVCKVNYMNSNKMKGGLKNE